MVYPSPSLSGAKHLPPQEEVAEYMGKMTVADMDYLKINKAEAHEKIAAKSSNPKGNYKRYIRIPLGTKQILRPNSPRE